MFHIQVLRKPPKKKLRSQVAPQRGKSHKKLYSNAKGELKRFYMINMRAILIFNKV